MAASGTGSLVFIDDVTADGGSRRSSAALGGSQRLSEAARKQPTAPTFTKIVPHIKEEIFFFFFFFGHFGFIPGSG